MYVSFRHSVLMLATGAFLFPASLFAAGKGGQSSAGGGANSTAHFQPSSSGVQSTPKLSSIPLKQGLGSSQVMSGKKLGNVGLGVNGVSPVQSNGLGTIKTKPVFPGNKGPQLGLNPNLNGNLPHIDPGLGNGKKPIIDPGKFPKIPLGPIGPVGPKPKIPICPPFKPFYPIGWIYPCCPSFFGGWCWYPGFGGCYGFVNGTCLGPVVTETVVVNMPVPVDSLPQIVPGTTVSLALAGLGDETGRIMMKHGSLAMNVEVVAWESGKVTFVVPSVALQSATPVELIFLRTNGDLVRTLECELVAAAVQQ